MLKFKMVESEDGKLVYRYFPEGKEDYGVISYDEKTGIIISNAYYKTPVKAVSLLE